MERRINFRIDAFMHALKLQIAAQFEEVRQKHAQNVAETPQLQDMQRDYMQIMNFIYESDKLKLSKDDFAKRKRVKNAVPVFDRCHAKRANGEQCTRRKKEGCLCCGTHTKGTPHFMLCMLIMLIICPQKHEQKSRHTKHCKHDVYDIRRYATLICKIQKDLQSKGK